MKPEFKNLTEKQEITKILKDFDDCIICDDEGGIERKLEIYLPKIMKIIAKVRKESIEYERERTLKNIGQLRQYLNERTIDKPIIDEELKTFLIS